MVLHVYCVVSGGIPIFYKSIGTEITPSFSELAPLNGVQVFGKVHSVQFKSTKGKDFTVHWKSFTEKLSLILLTKKTIYDNGECILNCIFESMVLVVGIDELTNVRHVDRLKKDIRPCYAIIDTVLSCVDECSEIRNSRYLLSMVELIPCANSTIFQDKLNEWSQSIFSLFCCLIVKNKIIVATSAWWDLADCEKSLLSTMVLVNSNCTTVDIPVFLPVKSPNIAFRLVSCCLIADIWVCALCGPTPHLMEFEQSVAICWNSVVENLRDLSVDTTQIIPENVNTQNGITGILLINYIIGKYIVLGSVSEHEELFDVIRIFYYQNVKNLMEENDKNVKHKARETYWYSENYKLYALINDPNILCVMTSSIIPTYSVRSISKDIFTSIMNNKSFVW